MNTDTKVDPPVLDKADVIQWIEFWVNELEKDHKSGRAKLVEVDLRMIKNNMAVLKSL